jgi:hypothetical protein
VTRQCHPSIATPEPTAPSADDGVYSVLSPPTRRQALCKTRLPIVLQVQLASASQLELALRWLHCLLDTFLFCFFLIESFRLPQRLVRSKYYRRAERLKASIYLPRLAPQLQEGGMTRIPPTSSGQNTMYTWREVSRETRGLAFLLQALTVVKHHHYTAS